MLPDLVIHELAVIYTFFWFAHFLIVAFNCNYGHEILEIQSFFDNSPNTWEILGSDVKHSDKNNSLSGIFPSLFIPTPGAVIDVEIGVVHHHEYTLLPTLYFPLS